MKSESMLVINTRVETKQAELELKSLTETVTKALQAIGAVVGQVGRLVHLKGLLQPLQQGMAMVEGQIKDISKVFGEQFTNLKLLVENAVIPIASMLMTLGNSVVDFFTAVAAVVGTLTDRMFGSLTKTGKAGSAAAKGQTTLAKATTAAGAAAKGTLAAFDELNVLEQKKGGAGGGTGGKPEKPTKPEVPEGGGLFAFLEQLLKAMEPLTEEIFAGLTWGYENVLKPLGEWAGNELLPAFLETVGKGAQLLATVLETLKPVGTWLWESFLQPLGQWSGEMVILALDGIAKAFEAMTVWIEENKAKLGELWETVEPLFTLISEVVLGILDGIKTYFALWIDTMTELLTGMLDFWLGLITGDWELMWLGLQTIQEAGTALLLGSLNLLWEGIKSGFGKCWEAVKLLWTPVGEWFMQNVLSPLNKNFGWLWDGIVLAARISWQAVQGIWEPLSQWFMDTVAIPVAGVAKKLWEDICGAFDGGLNYLKGTLKSYMNFCLDMFEGGANVIVDIFNRIIAALNTISVDIPDWVPEYGGRSFGISIPKIPPVSMPRLATGAVIPPNAQFAAILGDQRAGNNLEAPEGLIREIVREESGAREIVVRFEGSMAQLARVLVPAIEQENARQGTRLIF